MSRPELLIEGGPLDGKRFSVGDKNLSLGRSSKNDVHVPDEELSRNHCMFEKSGESGLSVVDLVSANGTFVNGKRIDKAPVSLKPGDIVTAGSLRIKVVSDDVVASHIDLGFNTKVREQVQAAAQARGKGSNAKKKSGATLWVLRVVALLAVIGAAAFFMLYVDKKDSKPQIAEVREDNSIQEVYYEKVDADNNSIFRYCLELVPGGTMRVTIDDLPRENRQTAKSIHLSEKSLARLEEIFSDAGLQTLDREYVGEAVESTRLQSRILKIVYGSKSRSFKVVNTAEPEAFQRVREKLETFSKNELGIWAIQYSSEKLRELAEASVATAKAKFDEREAEYGNLSAAISAYKEAAFYLETVNPKPDYYEAMLADMKKAKSELDERYREQRFRADRAINTGDWDTAISELRILCAMIPDRDDERNRDAKAKLVDIEKRKEKGGVR